MMPWVLRQDAQDVGTLAGSPFDAMTGTLDAPRLGRWVERNAAAPDPLVNASIVAKSSNAVPQQLTQSQGEKLLLKDTLMRYQDAVAKERADRSALGNFAVSGLKDVGNMILGAPSTAINTMNAVPNAITNALGFQIPNMRMPVPNVDDAAATLRGVQAVSSGQDFTPAYRQAQTTGALAEGARETERPYSTAAGTAAGDLSAILLGRTPFAGDWVAAAKTPAMRDAAFAAAKAMDAGPARLTARIWNAPVVQSMRRAAGKSAEVSAEQAALSIFHGDDPYRPALYAGGAQLGGSLAMSMIKHPLYSAVPILGSALAWQYMKELTPGGPDSVTSSLEHAAKVGAWTTVAGLMAGLFGAGRYRGSKSFFEGITGKSEGLFSHKYAEDVPQWAEAVNAAFRTGPNSAIRQYFADKKTGDTTLSNVMGKLNSNVNLFSQKELMQLSRAVTNGRDLRATVQQMLNDPDFARRMGY